MRRLHISVDSHQYQDVTSAWKLNRGIGTETILRFRSRLPPPIDDRLDEYNAVQMHYENLGEGGNALAPHLVQGFAFDRDTGDEDRYWLPEGNASNAIEVGNTPS